MWFDCGGDIVGRLVMVWGIVIWNEGRGGLRGRVLVGFLVPIGIRLGVL